MKQVFVADSGSTSTNWSLVSEKGCTRKINTQGINPYYMGKDEICRLLQEQLLPSLSEEERHSISEIYFYGSGCSTENKRYLITDSLRMISPNASIFADHDVLASARASCGEGKGIACILGTGSNSCVYNGKEVVKNAISLGYLLGDEGSSIHIGKLFLTRFLKNRVSSPLKEAVNEHFKFSFEDILNGLYQSPKPNQFIAQFTYYVIDHVHEFPELEEVVRESFTAFVQEYIRPFPESSTYPIQFVGSVAYLLQDILREVFDSEGYQTGRIVRYPIDGLILYHQQLLQKSYSSTSASWKN